MGGRLHRNRWPVSPESAGTVSDDTINATSITAAGPRPVSGGKTLDTKLGSLRTPEALGTFPRYNVLNAIRVELERIDPSELGDLRAAKMRLLCVGETPNDDFTLTPIGAIDQRAIAEERAAFCSYIGELSAIDLTSVEPLPFRCVLAADESAAVWTRIRKRWQISGSHWYPLTESTHPGVEAFDSYAFGEAIPPSACRVS